MTIRIPIPSAKAVYTALILFLVGALVFSVVRTLPIYQQPTGVWTVDSNAYSVEHKKLFIQRLDALMDRLPEQEMLITRGDMVLWAIEILPYMTYEGLSGEASNVPADLQLFIVHNNAAFHLAGQAACRDRGDDPVDGPIFISGRYVNIHSAWYGRETALGTLVHELIHMQHGPFCSGESEVLEANTQIASIEVMAAMVNHGNVAVLRPLLAVLRQMGLSALQYDLSHAEYMAFLNSVSDDPFEIARQEKSYRYWMGGNEEEFTEILRKYNVVPFDAIIEGLYDGDVERITFGTWDFEEERYVEKPLACDDWQWFMAHVDEYVSEAQEATEA